MKLTITIRIQQKPYDIQVPDSQKIMETLQILNDNLDFFCMDSIPEYVQERDSGRKISTRCTYEQAHAYGTGRWTIVNGNVLKLTDFYGSSDTYELAEVSNDTIVLKSGRKWLKIGNI